MLVFHVFIFNALSGSTYDILGCPSLAHFTFSIVFQVLRLGAIALHTFQGRGLVLFVIT